MGSDVEAPAYHTVSLSARPARLAVALPPTDHWKTSALITLEALSRCWGGAGDIIFRAEDETVPDPIWRVLEAFDADAFGFYAETFGAWRRTAPEAFGKWLEETAARFVSEGSSNNVEQWREQLQHDSVLKRQRIRWKADETLGARVVETMSPFRWKENVFRDVVLMDWMPHNKFVDVVPLEPVAEASLLVPDLSEFGEDLQLLMAARTGLIGERHARELSERGVVWAKQPVSEGQLSLALEYAWTGGGSYARQLGKQPLDEVDPTPFGHTLTTLAWFGRESWPPPPYILVVGNGCNDFMFALALDRLTRSAGWVPTSLLGGPLEQAFLRALNSTVGEVTRFGTEERRVVVCSFSLSERELAELIKAVAKAGFSPDADEWLSVSVLDDVAIGSTWRLWDRSVNQRASSEAFVGGVQAGPLLTPLASISTPERGTSVGWIVDADIAAHRLPTRSCLETLASAQRPFDWAARPGRDGISYFSFGGFIEAGVPVELSLSRPRLRLPTADQVFAQLLENGRLRAEESAAGMFARQTLELWGSLDRFADALASPAQKSMLMAYLSTAASEVEPGVFLDASRRRFLTFENLRTVSAMTPLELRRLLDDWLVKRILRRGLVLQCPACRFSGWYDVEDIGQSYRCLRCRNPNELLALSWKAPTDEPKWYYELAETVYQAMASNVEAPVRTLRALKAETFSFDFTHEMELFDVATDEHLGELDIWVIRNGKVVIGEVTSVGNFGGKLNKKLLRLRRVAEAVTADEIVFATTAGGWDQSVIDAAQRNFGGARARPLFQASV
jgi:hypothetical protein